MAKQTLMRTLGVVVGVIAGMAIMMGLHMSTMAVYPPPEGVDLMSQEPENVKQMHAWFETLPAGAFLLAALCHGLGCLSGAVIAMFVSGRGSVIPAVVIGVLFTAAGIANLSSIPHPSWFPFVDVPIYLAFALPAGLLLRRNIEAPDAAATVEPSGR